MFDTYTTPEGFVLPHRLLMPGARRFEELFDTLGAWNYGSDIREEGMRLSRSRFVSTFCAVHLGLKRGTGLVDGSQHLRVTPTPDLLALLTPNQERFSRVDEFAFFDRISFEIIEHRSNGRALVIANASAIIASRWLAYIDPASVPDPAKVES
jgi:hypothetical protein